MNNQYQRYAGALLAIGAAQFLVMLMLLESIAPGYSMNDNAISDLGTIPETETWFTITLFAIGVTNLMAGWFFLRSMGDKVLFIVFLLGSIGAMGAALIPLDNPSDMHGLFALMAFLFMNVEAVLVGLKLSGALKVISILAGLTGLVFMVMMIFVDSGSIDVSGSIGHGGVERMIAYPVLIWMVLIGGYLQAGTLRGAKGG